MPTFNIVFTLVCQNGVMEPNEWQKKKNNKTTEYTQDLILGIDTGSRKVGSAVVNNKNEVIYVSEVEIRNDITD